MSIQQELRDKLTAAIRAKDLKTANIIRMVDTKVMERRTAKNFSGDVDDLLYTEVIGAYKKSLVKARGEFEKGGERGVEQIAELDFEIKFLDQYLPELLTEDAAREVVRGHRRQDDRSDHRRGDEGLQRPGRGPANQAAGRRGARVGGVDSRQLTVDSSLCSEVVQCATRRVDVVVGEVKSTT
jgi:uncharacterized protein YqeY